MGLAAFVHLELELGVTFCELGEQPLDRLRLLAGQERQDSARTRQQALDDGAGDVVEALASGNRISLGEPEPATLANRESVRPHIAACTAL